MSLVLLDSGTVSGGAGQDLVSSISGAATVSAGLKVAHRLVATSIGISVVTVPKLDRNRGFSATINGVGTVNSDLAAIRLIASPINGVATVTASLPVHRTLRTVALEAGVCTVSAALGISSLIAHIDGTSTVTAALVRNVGIRPASIDGRSTLSAFASVFHRMSATEHGAGTITSAFNVLIRGSANVIVGQATVSASLSRRIKRTATSNLSIIAEYRRIVGILMLVDPSFQIELSTPPTAQTFTFVKKVVKGLSYVDMQAAGSVLTCQVRTGDGIAKTGTTDVALMLAFTGVAIPPAAPIPPAVSVLVGTLKSGAGTNILWIQTTNAGTFSLSVAGAGDVLVQAIPQQGVAMSAGLSL